MANELSYLGIIPARGGSKRFPGKNIAMLNGQPLIAHTINAAAHAQRLTRTIVSTDDAEIAAVAKDWGGDVPFMRPALFAADQSPAIDVITHALEQLDSQGSIFDAVVLLQPTSPFRTGEHIDAAIALFEKTGADTVTSGCSAQHHPYYSWMIQDEELTPLYSLAHQSMPRQELPPVFYENGAIFVIKRAVLARGAFYGSKTVAYLMDQHSSIDIDTPEDLALCRFILEQRSQRPC